MDKLKDTRPCKKCGGEMKKGVALLQTFTYDMPDFIGDEPGGRGCTMSFGGPGKLVEVLKCTECGWSYMENALGGPEIECEWKKEGYCKECAREDICQGAVSISQGDELKVMKSLVRQLFEMLDCQEENMNGNLFHPTFISSCRIMHTEKLGKILPRLKELSKEAK